MEKPKIVQNMKKPEVNKAIKKTRRHLKIEEKIDIINAIEHSGLSYHKLAKAYGCTASTIRYIHMMKDKIETFMSENKCALTRKLIKARPFKELEDELFRWYEQMRRLNQPVSAEKLRSKALELNEQMQTGERKNFLGSYGWLKNFRKRYGIKKFKFTNDQQPPPSNKTDIKMFKESVFTNILQQGYTPDDIYIAYESGIFWKVLPKQATENCTLQLKCPRDKVTVLFCANVAGNHKLPLFVIGRIKTPQNFNRIKPLPIHYVKQEHDWMSNETFGDWFKNIFITNVNKYKSDNHLNKKTILIVDHSPAHINVELLNSVDENFKIMLLPANVLPLIQSMNNGIVTSFKKKYRKYLLNIYKLILREGTADAIGEFFRRMSLADALFYFVKSWERISSDFLRQSRMCFMGNDKGGSSSDNKPVDREYNLCDEIAATPEEITKEQAFEAFMTFYKWARNDQKDNINALSLLCQVKDTFFENDM